MKSPSPHSYPSMSQTLLPVAGPVSAWRAKGVGLEHCASVGADHAELVYIALLYAGQEGAPDAALQLLHRGGAAVPAVEVADDADLTGVGRPDNETGEPRLGDILACEGVIGSLSAARVEQPDVIVRDILLCQLYLIHNEPPASAGVRPPFRLLLHIIHFFQHESKYFFADCVLT